MTFRSWMPYENKDGTFHVLEVGENGGFIVADQINDRATAELIYAAPGLMWERINQKGEK